MKSQFCSKCNSWRGQLGLEPTYSLYVNHLLLITDELKRVLKNDGSFYLNLGDTYSSKPCGSPGKNTLNPGHPSSDRNERMDTSHTGVREKSLIGIPERVMLSMMDQGFTIRNKIIWHKCLAGKTLMFARVNGRIMVEPLRDIVRYKNVELPSVDNGRITWVKMLSYEKRRSNGLLLMLGDGSQIVATKEHRFPTPVGLVEASTLKPGDNLISLKLFDLPKLKNANQIDYEYGWIIGLYLAEGCANKRVIQLALHRKESNLAERVEKFFTGRFGFNVTYYIYGNSRHCNISDHDAVSLITRFVLGYSTKNKHLDAEAFQYGIEFLRGIIDGWLDGDGHCEISNNRYKASIATNRHFLTQLRIICRSLGYSFKSSDGFSKCGEKYFPIHRIEIRKERLKRKDTNVFLSSNNQTSLLGQDLLVLKIKSIKSVKRQNFYDISVDRNHVFAVADMILTHNSNFMPQSVKDRLSNTYEYVYFFTKSPRYYYNLDAIRIPQKFKEDVLRRIRQDKDAGVIPFSKGGEGKWRHDQDMVKELRRTGVDLGGFERGRILNYKGKFGGMGERSEEFGSPRARSQRKQDNIPGENAPTYERFNEGYATRVRNETEYRTRDPERHINMKGKNPGDVWVINTRPYKGSHFAVFPQELCRVPILASSRPGDVVLDPFSGSGTVAKVARDLGRSSISIEINSDYERLWHERLGTSEGLDIIYKVEKFEGKV